MRCCEVCDVVCDVSCGVLYAMCGVLSVCNMRHALRGVRCIGLCCVVIRSVSGDVLRVLYVVLCFCVAWYVGAMCCVVCCVLFSTWCVVLRVV